MTGPIVVVATGDPEARSTWSGTPRALIGAFRDLGCEVSGLNASLGSRFDKAAYGLMARPLLGSGARAFRQYYGPLGWRLRQNMASHHRANPHAIYLHTDHVWTPFLGMGKRDFLFRDTSWRAYSAAQGISKRLRKRLAGNASAALSVSAHVFSTSQWALNELVQEGANPDKASVVGTGIGNVVDPFPGRANFAAKRTICIAKVRFHDKGLDLLLDGFEIARKVDPELELDLIVPKGTVRPRTNVRIHSDVSLAKLNELYRGASLFAMPARYEPWGLVYLEAQAAGLPVLGSAHCAFPELCDQGRTGFIVPELSSPAIAESLLAAHRNPALLAAMSNAAVQFANRFSWKNTAQIMLKIIKSDERL